MKNIIALLLVLFVCKGYSQTPVSITKAFSTAFELGIPSRTAYSIGVGGSGKLEIPVIKPVSLSFTFGYSSFFNKGSLLNTYFNTVFLNHGPAQFIPLKAGVKYYFSQGFYVEGESGTAIEINYEKKRLFAFAIGPGFQIPTSNNRSIDIGFRYENWANHIRQTGVRIGYRIGW